MEFEDRWYKLAVIGAAVVGGILILRELQNTLNQLSHSIDHNTVIAVPVTQAVDFPELEPEAQQFMNRLIEYYDGPNAVAAAHQFAFLVTSGVTPSDAFDMVVQGG